MRTWSVDYELELDQCAGEEVTRPLLLRPRGYDLQIKHATSDGYTVVTPTGEYVAEVTMLGTSPCALKVAWTEETRTASPLPPPEHYEFVLRWVGQTFEGYGSYERLDAKAYAGGARKALCRLEFRIHDAPPVMSP